MCNLSGLLVTCLSQRNGWVRIFAINNLFKDPFISSLCVMNTIPEYICWWIFAWTNCRLSSIDYNCFSTARKLAVVVLASSPATSSNGVLKSCNYKQIYENQILWLKSALPPEFQRLAVKDSLIVSRKSYRTS